MSVTASYTTPAGDVVEGAAQTSTPHLDIYPVHDLQLFAYREPFSLYKFVTKPMNMMLVGTVLMIYIMPKMRVRARIIYFKRFVLVLLQ